MSHYKSLCLTFALLLCLLAQVSSQQKVPLPAAVINEMASRETRYHHYLWHNIRDNWNRFSSSTQSQIRNLGWAPPRPSKRYDSKGNAITISDNNSGEDFLYMHRQMIARANEIIASANDPYGKITGWKKIPVPGDSDWPVSSAYTIPGNSGTTQSVSLRKSRDFYYQNIKPMEDLLTDPSELRKMTLGELGTKLESTVHNWLHIRFSEKSSVGYRPSGSGAIPNFDKKWDDPQYNWLGDTYSSQVHPLFWKIHGWVDDRIEDWRVANKLSSIRWKGTWTGGPMSSLSNVLKSKVTGNGSSLRVPMNMESQRDKEESVDDIMQQVLDILLKTREESNFSDKIVLDFVLPSSSLKPKTNSKTRAPRQPRCKN